MSKEVLGRLMGVDPETINEALVAWAWAQRAGGPRQKLVLVVLCILADGNHQVEITFDDLVAYTSIHKRTLLSVINGLCRIGLISRDGDRYAVLQVESPLGQGERLPLRVKPEVRAIVFARDGHACIACGSTRNLEVDHIVPRSRGGDHVLENLQTLCGPCNASKGDGDNDAWLASRRPVQ